EGKLASRLADRHCNTHQQAAAGKTRNALDYATLEPKDFRPLYRAEVPADQDHWHYNVDREVRLDRPARTVFVRYSGDPGVNNLCIYAHCLDDRPRAPAVVRVTHTCVEDPHSLPPTPLPPR